MKYIKLFENHNNYLADTEFLNTTPSVAKCTLESEVHYHPIPDYSKEYLTFVAKENGTFTFTPKNSNVISYSTDGGENWIEGNSVEVSNGDKVMWKGVLTPSSSNGIGTFSSTGQFDVQGNAMSLLFGDNFKGQEDLSGKDYAFYELFYNNTKIVNAKNLSLPATTLAQYCYNSMFQGCKSLTTAPKLPATTLATYCYGYMFMDCSSLVTAPELPAITLANSCYYYMFRDCTNLNYIKAMFTSKPSVGRTGGWVRGVASTGTFVKNSAATWDVIGEDGIPSGWTVQTATA